MYHFNTFIVLLCVHKETIIIIYAYCFTTYLRRLDVTKHNSQRVNMMETFDEINAKLSDRTLWKMIILFDDSI